MGRRQETEYGEIHQINPVNPVKNQIKKGKLIGNTGYP